ncbi:MAG: type transport system ATP-binding protein [Thermoplasmata archaeon]|jgi:ABC-2 type transport system ATP-binding protein|nr:type transport system ATP-binding protein [Thermoplasmata archaeon]
MAGPAIRTEGLTRAFQSVRAVDGLTLEVPRGVVFGFLGPNGSGKTTTIRLLLGLLAPTSGSSRVLDLDPVGQGAELRARCGALLEFPGLYERMSAEDNLEFAGRLARLDATERRARAREGLERVGLWERRKEMAGTWSRGMKQKLAVARALLARPELVFLDEPTAGLDPVAAAQLRDDLDRLVRAEGLTVFLTTHNLAEAEHLCGRVAVIREGRLLAVGTPAEVRARGSHGAMHVMVQGRKLDAGLARGLAGVREVSERQGALDLTVEAGFDPAPLVRALVLAGCDVQEVRRGDATLEETFLKLVEEKA